MGCHGPNGAGNPPANFARVSGQHTTYIEKAMKDYRNELRGMDEKDESGKIMRGVAENMSDAEIAAVAAYIAALN